MKTLATPSDLAAIRARLAALTPDDTALWGAMSVHQMLCHLRDSYELPLDERTAAPVKGPPIPLGLLKWIALSAPFAWPKGVPTPPEVDQRIGGTPPIDFNADRSALLAKLDTFARSTGPWAAHPVFGPLTTPQWMRWGYLHPDHHLRQFGQ
jgi:Protein of unknown function (DUF1569)